jgi:hypothetical protein
MKLRFSIAAAVTLTLLMFTPPVVALCPFRWLTDLPCPLCGMTRAMFLLAKGEWREALRLNALSPLMASAAVALTLFGQARMTRVWPWLAAVTLAYGLGRVLL